AHLIVKRPPSGVIAGKPFDLVIDAYDKFGNLATSFNDQVTASLASGSSGTLSGTTTQTAVNGEASFNDLVDSVSGPITLDATSGRLTSTSTGTVTISPAVPSKLVIQTQPSQTATAGQAFQTQPVIYEEDQYGNIETGDNSTVITAFLGSGAGPLQGTV